MPTPARLTPHADAAEPETDRPGSARLEAPATLEVDTAFAAEVVAALVHEVRQPLSGLMLNAEVGMRSLNRAQPGIEESLAALTRVLRDASRLAEMLERTKSVYLEAPRGFQTFTLATTLSEAVDFAWRRLNARKIDTVTRISSDSPTAWGNRLQIQQVVYNLIVNAAEAIEAAGQDPRVIEIIAEPAAANAVRIAVADTGCGFDLAAEPQLFQRFHTTKADGSGLGLSICGAILKAHGGALTAMPREPRGAIFSFTLPSAPP